MKKIIFIFLISFVVYSCSKTESTPTATPPVVNKLSSCDSIKQGLLKTTTDTIRLISCLSITGCDSVRLGILKPNRQDTLRLLSCIKISGCDSLRLGVLKANKQDSIRLISCFSLPAISTTDLKNITFTSAITGGIISSNGGAGIIARGVCWAKTASPTIANTKTNEGSGIGAFVTEIKGLTAGTTYYVRSYATNIVGTVYGNEIKFTTENYSFITIGTQDWMTKNLDVVTYRNGDTIKQVTDQLAWGSQVGAWSYYNNDPVNGPIYGKLYNWYALIDSRGLCPVGWHAPKEDEWEILIKTLGGYGLAGGKMKSTDSTLWKNPNTDATNESKFTGLPGGRRLPIGPFWEIGLYGHWWSTTERVIDAEVWSIYLNYNNGGIAKVTISPKFGLSVRCIKD